MSGQTKDPFPIAASSWLTPQPGPLLVVGRESIPVARRITRSQATIIDSSPTTLRKIAIRWPEARRVVAETSKLPFRPQMFSAILIAQNLTPLDPEVLPAFARTLTSQGQLLVQCTARDDSVPWVKRLAAILQKINPEAMTNNRNLAAADVLRGSRHFPNLEHRSFRLWMPITKNQLLEQVSRSLSSTKEAEVQPSEASDNPPQPDSSISPEEITEQPSSSVYDLPEGFEPGSVEADRYETALLEVADLYESSARAPEPLMLPYLVHCWRAVVDPTRVRADILFEDSLRITL